VHGLKRQEVGRDRLKGSDVVIEGVSKSFGSFRVLNDIKLAIQKGEFFSLLGPSGCGKTTLLRIIGGFETPDDGTQRSSKYGADSFCGAFGLHMLSFVLFGSSKPNLRLNLT
jgi:ABC-type polysaccharide/polyol phosphate transport system ATPase subunit